MRSLVRLFVGLLVAAAWGSSALSCDGTPAGIPQAEACDQAAKTACTKILGCTDPRLVLIQGLLQNEATCEATVVRSCGATGFQCSASQTYHADKAGECQAEFNRQTCDTLAAGIAAAGLNFATGVASLTASLPACGQICTGSDAGASTGG